MDSKIAVDIAKTLVKDEEKAYGLTDDRLWLRDNLFAQTTDQFRAAHMEGNIDTVHYPPKTSDKGLAPVDNGPGARVKGKIGELQENHLESDDNMEAWEGKHPIN